ncbi:MAG: Hpt domain-containing protein, partial [Verrucomicrobiota bacterium]
MKYQEQLFAGIESDRLAFVPNVLSGEVVNFLEQLPGLIGEQLKLVDELNLSGEDEELLDRLYRGNHILAGMAQLLGVGKIDRLLGMLDFALDLARSIKTIKRHSVDYLVALFYEKSVELAGELLEQGKIETEISDLIDETRNYLLEPLREWNRRVDESQQAFHNTSQPEEAPALIEAPASAAEHMISKAALPPPVAASAVDIPFDDEPETLNIPLDKVGMISDFYEENTEILNHFANLLLELESAEDTISVVNDLFRMIHTVKGGSRLLKIAKLECLAHTMENLLDLVRQKQIPVSSNIIDLLLDCKGALSEMVEEVASRGPLRTRIAPHVQRLQAVLRGSAAVVSPAPAKALEAKTADPALPKKESSDGPSTAARTDKAAAGTESLRVSSEKLDEVLNTASEIFIGRIRFQNEITAIQNFIKSFKLTLDRASDFQRNRVMARLNLYIPEFSKELKQLTEASRHRGRALENHLPTLFSNIVNRLLPDNSGLEMSLQEELNLNYLTIEEIQKQLQKNLETLERLSTRLQNGAMSFRMVPISNLFERFPLQLRDLARTVGKKIRVDIIGGDTELDKVLINRLADPLLHMLRNSIDHGIESPEERLRLGKPESGTITLKTYYHGSYAVIEIRDDGKGLNLERILAKALEKHLISESQKSKLSDTEMMELIFLPGFSTNDQVTELSGRGVGMDVVKTAINQLHGSVEIDSKAGEGSC